LHPKKNKENDKNSKSRKSQEIGTFVSIDKNLFRLFILISFSTFSMIETMNL